MEIPIYLTYADFISKYENDLVHYKLLYPDLIESEFLKVLKKQYTELENFTRFHRFKYYENETEIHTNIDTYIFELNKRYSEFLQLMQYENDELEKQHPEKELMSWERHFELPEIDFQFQLRYFIDKSKDWNISEHWFYINFVKFENLQIIFDVERLENFRFSRTRILDFIDKKTGFNKVGESPVTETPELDFSDNTDKVKLIMLEKLGVIDYIKTIQTKPETISHTSEILSTITGIPTKTLNTYLYPMIRLHRDDDDKNSPYKNPENREKAERELIKLKIKNIDANR